MIHKVLSKENISYCEILFKTRPPVDNTTVEVQAPPPPPQLYPLIYSSSVDVKISPNISSREGLSKIKFSPK